MDSTIVLIEVSLQNMNLQLLTSSFIPYSWLTVKSNDLWTFNKPVYHILKQAIDLNYP